MTQAVAPALPRCGSVSLRVHGADTFEYHSVASAPFPLIVTIFLRALVTIPGVACTRPRSTDQRFQLIATLKDHP